MNKINSLEELFLDQLRDLYSVEVQLVEALALMSETASCEELKKAFVEHLDGTVDHLNRLEEIFKNHDANPRGKPCAPMEGLVRECRDLIRGDVHPGVMDAGLIAIAQKAEHYEIAGYGTAKAYASLLEDRHAEKILHATLEEEKNMDRKLSLLAEGFVNKEARQAAVSS